MTRIALATSIKTRTGAPSEKDARLVNSYVEVKGEQSVVRKRPIAQGGVAISTGTAQGGIGFTLNGTNYIYTLNNDVGALDTLATAGTSWSSVTTYAIGDHVAIDFVDYWAENVNINSQPPSADWSATPRYYQQSYFVTAGTYPQTVAYDDNVSIRYSSISSATDNLDGTYSIVLANPIPLIADDFMWDGITGYRVLTRYSDYSFLVSRPTGQSWGSSIYWAINNGTFDIVYDVTLSNNHSSTSFAGIVQSIKADAISNAVNPYIEYLGTPQILYQISTYPTGTRNVFYAVSAEGTFDISGSATDAVSGDDLIYISPSSLRTYVVTATDNVYIPLGTVLCTTSASFENTIDAMFI